MEGALGVDELSTVQGSQTASEKKSKCEALQRLPLHQLTFYYTTNLPKFSSAL